MIYDVIVIGAGIAGLLAAGKLQSQGFSVLVLDKGRGVGGRLATRRLGPGRADHGAQVFTVRSDVFQAYVAEWLAQGVVYEWARGWGEADGHPRYAGRDGMTTIAKHLAQPLSVQTGCHITAVSPIEHTWTVTTTSRQQYQGRALLMTPPVPQSVTLLANGQTVLHPDDLTALQQVAYAPCLCGLFWIEGDVLLPEPGAVQEPSATVSWIADNQRKGISPEARLVTVHGGPSFSQTHYDDPVAIPLTGLQQALAPYLGKTAVIREKQLKKWRYARPVTLHPARTLLAQGLPPLAFAGDAFHEARVEGAALSGLAAAGKLAEKI